MTDVEGLTSAANDSTTGRPVRVLTVAHGHPKFAHGGGEVAAYNLHLGLAEDPRFESTFLARHDRDDLLHGGTPFAATGRPREILFHATMPDWFRFSQHDRARIWRDFREALETVRPDIVHFHHYLFVGLEAISEVRAWNPDARIVLTLHEYFALCHNHGQMVRPGSRTLCHESAPSDCARCYPEHSAQDFALRREFIRSHFDAVDRFLAPSEFLKGRYVQWGLDADRIEVVENVLSPAARLRRPPVPSSDDPGDGLSQSSNSTPNSTRNSTSGRLLPVRLSYFGQINGFKGLDVLLEAMDELPPEVRARVTLDINGGGLDRQSEIFRRHVVGLLARLGDSVRMRGPYRQDELPKLMAASDWMVMPSRWWENSPVVIQEAASHGLPVLASDIGGMAEKVEHDVTGLHFLVGRPESLAARIAEIEADRSVRTRLSHELLRRRLAAGDRDYDTHVRLYGLLADASAQENVAADHSASIGPAERAA